MDDDDRSIIPETHVETVGDRPVFIVTIGDIHEFDGTLTVSLAYEPKAGENTENLCVWYLKDDGSYEKIDCTYADGFVTFETDHLSLYAIMKDTTELNHSADVFVAGLVFTALISVFIAVRRH